MAESPAQKSEGQKSEGQKSPGQKSQSGELRFLAKHSVIYGVGTILSRLVAFLMLPIYTRQLTPFDYGVLEIIDTTTGMIGLVAGLGIAGAMSRFYFDFEAPADRRKVVSTTYWLVALTAGAIIAAILPFTSLLADGLFDNPSFSNYFSVALFGLGLGLVIDLGQVYLRIQQKSHAYVLISLANLILSVALNIYFVVYEKMGVMGVLMATLVSRSIIAVPLTVAMLRKVGLRLDWVLARAMYRYSLPLIPSDLASTAISYSDRYFINHYLTTADAGIYGLAQKLGTVLHMLVTSPFLLTYLPRRFEIAKQENAPQIFAATFLYHILVLTALSTVLALFARELLVIMTVPAYYPAANLMPVIAGSMIVLGMKYHFQFGLLYAKQTKRMMYANVASAVAHITLNFILIPWLGLWGALLASVIAYSLNTYLSLVMAREFYAIPYDFRRVTLLMLASAAIVCAGVIPSWPLWTGIAVKIGLIGLLAVFILKLRLVSVQQVRSLVQQARQRLGLAASPG